MKKRLFMLTLALVFVFALIGCTPQAQEPTPTPTAEATPTAEPNEPTDNPTPAVKVKIATLAGPTGMGLIQLMDDANSDKYDISIYTAPDQILPKIIKGEVDIASVPANLAAMLYNKTDKGIKVLVTNGLGVLYIVENGDSINTVADLKGKTINAIGQAATPEYILNEILKKNDLTAGEDVTIKYSTQIPELANMVVAGDVKIALLPEPFVSVVTAKNKDVKVKIDINEEWKEAFGKNRGIAMSATIVNTKFLEEHPEAVQAFMKDYQASIKFVNEKPNEAAELIAEKKIVGSAAIAAQAIPRCNLVYLDGKISKEMLMEYYQTLFDSDPKSVGGTLPDANLYYMP